MTVRKNSIIIYIVSLLREFLFVKRAGDRNKIAKTQELLNVYLIARPSSVGPRDRDDICH